MQVYWKIEIKQLPLSIHTIWWDLSVIIMIRCSYQCDAVDRIPFTHLIYRQDSRNNVTNLLWLLMEFHIFNEDLTETLLFWYYYVLYHLPLRTTFMRKEQMFHVDCFAGFLKHVCNHLFNTNLLLNYVSETIRLFSHGSCMLNSTRNMGKLC